MSENSNQDNSEININNNSKSVIIHGAIISGDLINFGLPTEADLKSQRVLTRPDPLDEPPTSRLTESSEDSTKPT